MTAEALHILYCMLYIIFTLIYIYIYNMYYTIYHISTSYVYIYIYVYIYTYIDVVGLGVWLASKVLGIGQLQPKAPDPLLCRVYGAWASLEYLGQRIQNASPRLELS